MLGAGHHSIIFINTMKIAKYLKFMIDENKFKQKLLMPGSKIKIRGIEHLYKDNYSKSLCLTSLNKNTLIKIKKNKKIKRNKIKFISIYPYQQTNSIYKKNYKNFKN